MIIARLSSFYVIFTVCIFCGKDYISLGRQAWRYRNRLSAGLMSRVLRMRRQPIKQMLTWIIIDLLQLFVVLAESRVKVLGVLKCIRVAVVLFAICSQLTWKSWRRNYSRIHFKIMIIVCGMLRIKINVHLRTAVLSAEYSFQDYRSKGRFPTSFQGGISKCTNNRGVSRSCDINFQ